MPVRDDYLYQHISGSATTVVTGAACKLIRIVVNTTANAATTVYNAPTSALSTSGVVGAVLKANIVENSYDYGIKFSSGLTVVTAGASDLTIVYANA